MLRALMSARDRADMSDELAQAASSWALRCHLGRERGHLLRPLALPAEAKVLEVGAGCGAVTRSLGEACGIVDALEPVPDRARLARLRTQDLDSVEVMVGTVDDLPLEPVYDVAVLVGVLEYVDGPDPLRARVDFLRKVAARVRPFGHVVCAIENRFGVAFLCGQPEEHTHRLFDGLEDYPAGEKVRTFGRRDLEALFATAGLRPQTLHVMPDYRFPRLVFSDALLAGPGRPLAWRVPSFPSLTSLQRSRLADERRVWRGLVENGLGGDFANSFLVVAGVGGPAQLWPAGQEAAIYSSGRRTCWITEARVHAAHASEPRTLARRRLRPDPIQSASRIRQSVGESEVVPGVQLTELMCASGDDALRALMHRWRELVAALPATDGWRQFDLWSDNVILTPDDRLVTVDREFMARGMSTDDVTDRSLLWTAWALADRSPPQRWKAATVGELMDELGEAAGIGRSIDHSALADREAQVAAEITGGAPGSAAFARARLRFLKAFETRMLTSLEQCALGQRDVGSGGRLASVAEQLGAAVQQGEALHGLLTARDDELARAQQAADRLSAAARESQRELDVVLASRAWRATAPARAIVARMRGLLRR